MTKFHHAILLLLIILVTGCTSMSGPGEGTDAQKQFNLQSLNGKALVYGRIHWLENGEERYKDKGSAYESISPRYLRVEDTENGSLSIEPDGRFFWVLPEGTYILHQIHWFDPWDGPHRVDPRVAFYVPSGDMALCIGTLQVDIQGKRDIIGGLWMKGRSIEIQDECAGMDSSAIDPSLDKKRLLMVHNHGLPDRPEALENRDQLIDFIRAIMPGLMTIY